MTRVAAVVLAAGAATRFGGPKQRLLLPRVLERLAASPVDEVVVVEGAYELCGDSPQCPARIIRCARVGARTGCVAAVRSRGARATTSPRRS